MFACKPTKTLSQEMQAQVIERETRLALQLRSAAQDSIHLLYQAIQETIPASLYATPGKSSSGTGFDVSEKDLFSLFVRNHAVSEQYESSSGEPLKEMTGQAMATSSQGGPSRHALNSPYPSPLILPWEMFARNALDSQKGLDMPTKATASSIGS